MNCKKILVFLAAALLFANCASKQEEKTAPAKNVVSGSVTINGKAENLSHIYARRMTRYLSPKSEYFALAFTNKPVPEDETPKLYEDNTSLAEWDFLKDKSITGVVFTVPKDRSASTRIRAEGQIIYGGRAYSFSGYFAEFSMQKGRMRGKTDWVNVSGAEIEYTPNEGSPFTYRYAVEFDVTPQGEPVNKEWEGAVSPDLPHLLSEPGTAQGAVSVDGKTVNLKYAYALRKRNFFDEPEETIVILATDKPVAEDVLLKTLSHLKTKEQIQGVLLTIYTERGKRAEVSLLHQSFDKGILNLDSQIESLSIGKDLVTATHSASATEGTHKWNYAVSIDLPFKR